MYYLGLRVWLDQPLLGAGWQSIREQQVYEPFLADAHRRFPDQPEQAFPNEADRCGSTGSTTPTSRRSPSSASSGSALFLALLGAGLVLGVEARAARAARAGDAGARRRCSGCSSRWGPGPGRASSPAASFAALSWFALGLVAAGGSRDRA